VAWKSTANANDLEGSELLHHYHKTINNIMGIISWPSQLQPSAVMEAAAAVPTNLHAPSPTDVVLRHAALTSASSAVNHSTNFALSN